MADGGLVALAVVFMVIPMILVFLRFWARAVTKAGFGVDDILILPALLLVVGMCLAQLLGAAIGNLGSHEDLARDSPMSVMAQRQTLYALNILFPLCNGLIKLSILALFRRIFRPLNRPTSILLIFLTILIVLWALGFTIASIFTCLPISDFFQLEPPRSQCLSNAYYDVVAITDLVTAIVVLALPIPNSLNKVSSFRMRFAAALLFLLGTFVVVAGAIRLCYYLIQGTSALEGLDSSYYTPPLEYWTIIENSVGIWCACLPPLVPLFSRTGEAAEEEASVTEIARHAPVGRPREGFGVRTGTIMRESDNNASDKTRETSYASGNSVVWPLPPTNRSTGIDGSAPRPSSKILLPDTPAVVKPVPPPKSSMGIARLPSTLKSHPPIQEMPEPPSEKCNRANSEVEAQDRPVINRRSASGRSGGSNSGDRAAPMSPVPDGLQTQTAKCPSRSNSGEGSSQLHPALRSGHPSRTGSGGSTSELPSTSNTTIPRRSHSGERAEPFSRAAPVTSAVQHSRSNSGVKIAANLTPTEEPYYVPAPLPPSASNVPPRKSSMRKSTAPKVRSNPSSTQPESSYDSNFGAEKPLQDDSRAGRRTGVTHVPPESSANGAALKMDEHEVSVVRDSRSEGLATFYAHDASSDEDLEQDNVR